MMASIMVRLTMIACGLLLSFAMGGPIDEGRDIEQINLEDLLEERLLARLEEAQRETAPQKPEDSDTNGDEKLTVQKLNSGITKIDITLDNKLIEQRILDCEKGYEMIITNDNGRSKRTEACYLHKMDQDLLDSVCKEKGERDRIVYKIKQEIKDKDFLSEDGPDSVCKNRPMFMIVPVEKRSPTDASKDKRSCSQECCSWGWWWGRNTCKAQCMKC